MWDWKSGVLVRFAGDGGEGVISCGDMLTKALVRTGKDIFTFRTFPAEIRGGPAMNQVRAVDGVALSQGDAVDMLVAFNTEACLLHLHELREGGIFLHDDEDWEDVPDRELIRIAVPLNKTAAEVGSKLSKNIVALGATGRALGLPIQMLQSVVREKFARKSEEVMAKNIDALRRGYDSVDLSVLPPLQELQEASINQDRVIMNGNEATVMGALAAGLQYFAGYPITPATEIMEGLAPLLRKFGGTMLQVEDEIASLASAIGASYAGSKSMTATSGPGLSLMCELISYASMAEMPVVIVDVQRGGPSTGLPTKVEQSDLDLAVYGGHGDAPRIVLAAGSVRGCFFTALQAFNLAEKYQSPVLLLTDQALATRTQEFQRPRMDTLEIVDRQRPAPEDLEEYKRYRFTSSGLSPMAAPGTPGGEYIATGLEHGEDALPNYKPENHMKMQAKRFHKIQQAVSEPDVVARFGAERSKVGIISWGSTEGAIRDALPRLKEMGCDTGLLQLRMLSPLPEDHIRQFLDEMDTILVPELNYAGQLARMMRAAFMRPFVQLNKTTGLPFTMSEIIDATLEVWKHGKDTSGLQVGDETDMVPRMR